MTREPGAVVGPRGIESEVARGPANLLDRDHGAEPGSEVRGQCRSDLPVVGRVGERAPRQVDQRAGRWAVVVCGPRFDLNVTADQSWARLTVADQTRRNRDARLSAKREQRQ